MKHITLRKYLDTHKFSDDGEEVVWPEISDIDYSVFCPSSMMRDAIKHLLEEKEYLQKKISNIENDIAILESEEVANIINNSDLVYYSKLYREDTEDETPLTEEDREVSWKGGYIVHSKDEV